MKLTKYNYNRVFGLKLHITTKAILDHILSYANENGIAYPSQERVAEELGLCRQTVANHMKKVENIKINGKPFVTIGKNRRKDGKYYHNTYIFGWLIAPDFYTRKHVEDILEKLQKEYIEMIIEEDINNRHVNLINKRNNRQSSYFNLEQIREKIDKLSTSIGLKKADVLQTICNIGYEIKENRTQINHLDKYLAKCFQKAGVEKKIKEIIQGIYTSFFEKEPDALFYVNWEGIADMI